MTATLVMAVFLAAVCGVAAAGLYLAWPRRLTAEEWVLHRRAMSAPSLPRVRVSPARRAGPAPLDLAAHLEHVEGLVSIVRADLALLRLGGQPVPASEQELLRGLVLRATVGGACGVALVGLVALSTGGLEVSPVSVVLPVASALLWPTWSWLSLRRRAGRLRAAIEYRLPRLLVAARVLLESGAATPEGALTHAITIYEDPAADLVREALLAREVRRLPLESILSLAAEESAPVVRQAACGTVSRQAAEQYHAHQSPVKFVQDPASAATAQLAGVTSLDGTREQLYELPGSRVPSSPALIWVSAEDSLEDALAFWNMRALMLIGDLRPPACAVTPDVLRDKAFREALEQALRSQRWQQAEPDILLGSATIGPRELEELASEAGWEIHREGRFQIAYYGGGIPEPKGPRKAAVSTNLFPGLLCERRVGQSVRLLVHLHRTGTVVLSDSPVRFTRPILAGHVRARFSGAYEFSLPPGSSIGNLFHQVGVAVGEAVELETAAYARYEFHLAVPTRAELLAASVREAGLSLSLSDKGLLAEGVAARLSDLEVLRRPLVLRCVEALTTHRIKRDVAELREQFTEANEEILEEIAASLQNLRQVSRPLRHIASRTGVPVPEAARALEDLVATGLALRGLQATCGTCGMSSFIELRDLKEGIACPGCGSPAAVAVDPNRGESELHYRLNSLVDRASENGALVHLLAVAALRRRDPRAHVSPGVNLSTATKQPREADILGLLGSEIWLGEAKTSAGWFTPKQIDRDLAMAGRLRAAHYLMSCLQPVREDARRVASAGCEKAGIKLWVLEGHGGEVAEVLP